MVIACLASIPERRHSLARTVASLAPQVDRLFIALNGYHETPPEVREFDTVRFHTNEGDAAKFHFFCKFPTWADSWFFCDDDLEYPSDYISQSLKHLEKHPGAVLSYHGRRMKPRPVASYYKDRRTAYRCLFDVEGFHDLGTSGTLGTGVMFFRRGVLKIKPEAFKFKNMADIWLAKFATEQGRPMIVCPHPRDWIKYQEQPQGSTIFEQHYEADQVQTNLYNSINGRT